MISGCGMRMTGLMPSSTVTSNLAIPSIRREVISTEYWPLPRSTGSPILVRFFVSSESVTVSELTGTVMGSPLRSRSVIMSVAFDLPSAGIEFLSHDTRDSTASGMPTMSSFHWSNASRSRKTGSGS